MFDDVIWRSMMFYDVLWCSIMLYDVLWHSLMFYYVLWCSLMFYDVLWCLKSILGFFLSERTSGVSPVIFFYKIKSLNSFVLLTCFVESTMLTCFVDMPCRILQQRKPRSCSLFLFQFEMNCSNRAFVKKTQNKVLLILHLC